LTAEKRSVGCLLPDRDAIRLSSVATERIDTGVESYPLGLVLGKFFSNWDTESAALSRLLMPMLKVVAPGVG